MLFLPFSDNGKGEERSCFASSTLGFGLVARIFGRLMCSWECCIASLIIASNRRRNINKSLSQNCILWDEDGRDSRRYERRGLAEAPRGWWGARGAWHRESLVTGRGALFGSWSDSHFLGVRRVCICAFASARLQFSCSMKTGLVSYLESAVKQDCQTRVVQRAITLFCRFEHQILTYVSKKLKNLSLLIWGGLPAVS